MNNIKDSTMKTRRHPLVYIAHIIFSITFTLQSYASSGVIARGLGATLVCPFTVAGGPKLIGTVTVACFNDPACNTFSGNNASWGNRVSPPTLQNGSHTLSNDAMASVGLPAACAAAVQSIQLQVQNTGGSVTSVLCMQATVVSGIFTCSTSGTLNISTL